MMELLRAILFLPPGASTMADEIDKLHFVVIGTTMLGATGIFAAVIWFTLKYRRRSDQEYTEKVRAPVWFEVLVIGGLLSLFLAFWVVGMRQYGRMHKAPEDALTVYVTAKQWMWKFSHPQGRSSVGYLVVPAGEPVRLLITSRDVIHSFYVPAFRIKQDAVPGRWTSIWFEADRRGSYPLFCAEYCGQAHSRMWGSVVVLEPRDYRSWLDGAMPDRVREAQANARVHGGRYGDRGESTLIEQGEQAAARYGCLGCHTVTGQRHIGPSWRGIFGTYEELENGERVFVDEEYLTESMMQPEAKVVAGFDPVMPSFMGVLPQPEVAALVEYIKALETSDEEPVVNLPPVEARQVDAGVAPLIPGVDAGMTGFGDAGAPDRPRPEVGGP